MNTASTEHKTGFSGRTLAIATCAVMTAAICIASPFSIPIGPVPISLATLIVCLSAYILGWKMGTVSVCLYLLIGLIGLPVFSGFSGGFAKLAGPTGGYLIGYIPLALITGLVTEKTINRVLHFTGIIAGTALLYTLGTACFCIVMDCDVAYALGLCVYPFIPGDIAKTVIAVVLGPILKERIRNIRSNS